VLYAKCLAPFGLFSQADLLSYPDKKVQSLGNQLKHIKKIRDKADYNKLNKKFYHYEASRLLSSAKKISIEVKNFLQ
jgi:hypothetical protein